MKKRPWWKFWKSKEERADELYNTGFDWALKKLQRCVRTSDKKLCIAKLQGFVSEARAFETFTAFDDGILDAIQYFKSMKGEVNVKASYRPE